MKKIIFSLLGLTLLVVAGCEIVKVPVKQTETQQKFPQQTAELQKAEPWRQSLDMNIQGGDPINFYNQYPIIVEGTIPIRIPMFQDGHYLEKDSSIVYDYSVPKMTKGKLLKVVYRFGKPVSFLVEFKLDDPNSQHIFNVEPMENFTLYPGKKELTISGKKYFVPVAINGDGSGKCSLMHFPETDHQETTVKGVATGVPDEQGSKLIKK